MFTSAELRKKYLEFFKEKQHAIIQSAPLVPENDPSVLFNTAGMQPLVPYLMGEKHPMGNKLADCQKCIRTVDIEEVGDNTHLTFFEMLGNWSLGDYFKTESLQWSWEFLTSPQWLGLNPEFLAVTVFKGNEKVPRDETSAKIWKEIGVPENRISYLGVEDNWWAAGPTGPCGPDSEIFYWVGPGTPPANSNVENDEDNWMEIWNNVFMEFNQKEDGTLENLPSQNVDTGMGLERITATLNGVTSVYETDIFSDVIEEIRNLTGETHFIEHSARIVADHIRTATHLIADNVFPSNMDQGYILRRLIRRAIRQMFQMNYEKPFTKIIAQIYIEKFENIYNSISENKQTILDEIHKEEEKFSKTIKQGLKEFEKLIHGYTIAYEKTGKKTTIIDGKKAFKLFDTYGFPLEMTQDLAKEHQLDVDSKGFEEAFEKHQQLSRTAAAGKFKGGLSDDGEETIKLHSATHLMLAGLRKILGDHVHQAGSNITAERARFDFTHGEKMTPEQILAVEDYVNQAIAAQATMTLREIPKDEAKNDGVEGSFWEKYPEIVKVYEFTDAQGTTYSKELCGGPHVKNTKDLGKFKIKKEQSSSAGIRRIKAILQ